MGTRTSLIQKRIDALPEGAVLAFADLFDLNISAQALAVIISRFVKQGLLSRLSKGLYGKPKSTRFGTLLPSDNQVIDSILRSKSGQLVGYISGVAAYNKLGLTSQIPSEILLAVSTSSRKLEIGKLKLQFIRSRAPITEETAELLPILDALRDAKKIPDTSADEVVTKIKFKIEQLDTAKKKTLSEVAISYAPRVRAVLGAIFESLGELKLAEQQKKILNPISNFKIGLRKITLPNAESWNIQ